MKKLLATIFMGIATTCLCEHRCSQEMAVYFEHVKRELPQIEKKILTIEKKNNPSQKKELEKLKKDLKLYTVVNAVENQNVEALKKMSPEQLSFVESGDGDVWVPGEKLKDILGKKVQQIVLGGDNAIFFVILHSTTNKTEEDNQKTLEMLTVLLEKNLSLDAKSGIAYFVGGKDFVALYSLAEAALLFSFPEALEMVLKREALFYKHNVTTITNKMKKNNNPNIKKFQKLLRTYKSQQRNGHEFFSCF